MAITKRLYFLDNLRVAVTILLIAHHVGQAYGPTGGWWPIQEAARASVLGPFFTVNRSFFMSLFFMISGHFTVMSCDAKGPGAFMKSRLLRLGIPVLIFALVMLPMQIFVFKTQGTGGGSSAWPIEVGHLWFLEHLLIFSGCYALWHVLRQALEKNRADKGQRQLNPPGFLSILVFVPVLAFFSALVRIWYPIDRWVYLLGFIRVAFADVPRDLSFFIIGVAAYRRQWLTRFPTRAGRVWLLVGTAAALLWYVYALGLKEVIPVSGIAYGILYPSWEALLCCGMCIGLTILFRDKFDFQGRLARAMTQSQYASYIFHVPIILLIQLVMVGINVAPIAKFFIVTFASVPLTFLFSYWVRKPLRL